MNYLDKYNKLNKCVLDTLNPETLRKQLSDEMNNDYRYNSYKKSREIVRSKLSKINIYGNESDNEETNIEHVFPQSYFKESADKNKMRSDLHNLYLCNSKLNRYRQNFKYVDSCEYYKNKNKKDELYLDEKGNQVESVSEMFEKEGSIMMIDQKKQKIIPTEYSKGKISRSLSYIAIKYNFVSELKKVIDYDTLIKWNIEDPVDNDEYLKNIICFQYQGNLNPFIIDPELVYLSFSDKVSEPIDTSIDIKTIQLNYSYFIDYLLHE